MKEGDIVLTVLPQSSGPGKTRPALVLRQMPGFGDLLVYGISTQLRQMIVGFDEIIEPSHPEFRQSGLKAASLIRLGYLASLPTNSFLGKIGSISSDRHLRLVSRLSEYLKSKEKA